MPPPAVATNTIGIGWPVAPSGRAWATHSPNAAVGVGPAFALTSGIVGAVRRTAW